MVSTAPFMYGERGLIDTEAIVAMGHGAYFITAKLGECVDEDAPLAAIRSGHLAVACFDVFGIEPLPIDNPRRAEENVIVSLQTSLGGLRQRPGRSVLSTTPSGASPVVSWSMPSTRNSTS